MHFKELEQTDLVIFELIKNTHNPCCFKGPQRLKLMKYQPSGAGGTH